MGQRSPRDDNAQEHCEYPFGPEEERLMHFAVEVAYKRPPIQIEVKNGGYHEDQAEPDMQTAPLILRQSQHSPTCPVRDATGWSNEQYDASN